MAPEMPLMLQHKHGAVADETIIRPRLENASWHVLASRGLHLLQKEDEHEAGFRYYS